MNKNWKDIWDKRTNKLDQIAFDDTKNIFLELKRIDGFDVDKKSEGGGYTL